MAGNNRVNTSALPLSLTPSGNWDGLDGNWSTFWMQVGTPPQTLRLLPGTSAAAGSVPWVLNPDGCGSQFNPELQFKPCSDLRGGVFFSNKSTSWSTQGLDTKANGAFYGLNTVEETLLGLDGGGGSYGFDTVTFGVGAAGFPQVDSMLLASIASNEYWLGSLGISPLPISIGDVSNQKPSLVNTLKAQGHLPSLSWGYSAGAHYKEPPVFGSLTLGGYDESRFVRNNVAFAFAQDVTRDLLVNLQSITYDTTGSYPLLTDGIDIFLDSMIPDIWLPISACQAFEQAFNLRWNSAENRYLIDDSTHEALQAQNPSFTFAFSQPGQTGTNVPTAKIVLPYAAFDLTVNQPLVANNSRYFPLKQAQNSTQYTLGRAFFQEAYVIADYERKNFSIFQAAFPPTSTPSEIKTIYAPGAQPPQSSQTQSSESKPGSSFNKGKLAGIIVGCITLTLLAVGIIAFLRQHYRRKLVLDNEKAAPNHPLALDASLNALFAVDAENDTFASQAVYHTPPPMYLDENSAMVQEVSTSDRSQTEMDASEEKRFMKGRGHRVHELYGAGEVAAELDSPCFELASPGEELDQIRRKRANI